MVQLRLYPGSWRGKLAATTPNRTTIRKADGGHFQKHHKLSLMPRLAKAIGHSAVKRTNEGGPAG